MTKNKGVLTTGDVARICSVAPRTVTKWFDSGQLNGYRIPGSRDRRIPAAELIRFMKAHNMPIDGLEKGKMRILIIDSCVDSGRKFSEALRTKGSFDVVCAESSFDAGLLAEKFRPQVLLINLMAGHIDAQQLCTHIRRHPDLGETKIIALAADLTENEIQALKKKGFDAVSTNISDVNQTVHLIQECCPVFV